MTQQRERRFSERVAVEMPVTWYLVGPDGQARSHGGCLDDVSTTGVGLLSTESAAAGKLIALAIRTAELDLDAVGEVRRLTRWAGGWRMGVVFLNLSPEQRVKLTRLVLGKRV